MLTIDECGQAKTVLDPSAGALESENFPDAPKGCSRHKGTWYFNTHAEGAPDGKSEPVCKAKSGEKSEFVCTCKKQETYMFLRTMRAPLKLQIFSRTGSKQGTAQSSLS